MDEKWAFSRDDGYQETNAKYKALHQFASHYMRCQRLPRPYLEGTGISTTEVHVLTLVSDNPGITVTEIARMMSITPGAASQFVGKLDRMGLLRREKQPDNAKLVHLTTTEEGEALAVETRAYSNYHISRVLQALKSCSQREVESFFKVAHRMDDLFQQMLADPSSGGF